MSIWPDLLLSDNANYQDIAPILLQLSQKIKKKWQPEANSISEYG